MPLHGHRDSPMIGHRGDSADVIAPDGSEIRLLVDQRHEATRASLVEVRLPAGAVSRPVWHRTVEEIWYVLEGQGRSGVVHLPMPQTRLSRRWWGPETL